jgi:hypothetical protein
MTLPRKLPLNYTNRIKSLHVLSERPFFHHPSINNETAEGQEVNASPSTHLLEFVPTVVSYPLRYYRGLIDYHSLLTP